MSPSQGVVGAPQCCAWRSIRGRRRVRRLISQPSRQLRRSSGKVGWRLRVCGQWAVPTRDAQPFNREDKQRRVAVARFCQRTAAVVCLSSQTLGITVGRHAFGPPQPSLGFEMKCPRPSLLLRVSPPNTWRAFQGAAVRLHATVPTRCYAYRPGATSLVLSTLRLVALGGCCSASSQGVVGASRRSAAPGG